jgi:putative polyhydroxyalkanoic acid system protein
VNTLRACLVPCAAPRLDAREADLSADDNSGYARPSNALGASVSDTVTVIVGHRLGKAEAVRRIKDGFARADGHLGPMMAMEQESWEGDTLRFRMRALGQAAAGSIEVLEDALRIEVSLPWLLAKAAKHVLPMLRKQGTLLLEKK